MLTLDRTAISAITNWTENNIRHMQAHRYTPWDESNVPPGAHRRYDGAHGLCLTIAELLVAQNLTVRNACTVVNEQIEVVNQFLDCIDRDEHGNALFIAHVGFIEEDDALPGVMTPISWGNVDGTAEGIITLLKRVMEHEIGVSRPTRNGASIARGIAGPFLSAVPVQEAYSLLVQRAVAAGFLIRGRSVSRIGQTEV